MDNVFPWLRENIIESDMPLIGLEPKVKLAYDSNSSYSLNDKSLFGQFSGAPGVEEAKGYSLRDKPNQAAEALFNHFRDRKRPFLFLKRSEMNAIAEEFKLYPLSVKALTDSATQGMKHIFYSYSFNKQETFNGDINWFYDFESKSWPKIAVKELRKILDPANASKLTETPLAGYSSLERTWELNEHYHLLDLSRYYWLTKKDNAASEILIQMIEWGASNQLWMGVNWLNFDTIAIRLMNWMLAVDMCLDSPAFTPRIFTKIIETMILHGAALAWHLNNDKVHSFPAAACLYMFSIYFPELKSSKTWQSIAISKLPDLIKREFGENSVGTSHGLHLGGSLCLHCATAEWLLLPVLQHYCNGTQPPQFISEALHVSLEALQAINGTNRVAPHIGTFCAPGFLGRHSSLSEYIQTILTLGAVIFNYDELLCGIERMPAEVTWWLAPNPTIKNKFGEGRADYFPQQTEAYFVANGIGTIRDHWGPESSQVIIKGCPTNYHHQDFYRAPNLRKNQTSPHCDFLSVVLTIKNEPFLIDSGFSTYLSTAYPYLNSFFSHSTPTIKDEIVPFRVACLSDLNASERELSPDAITDINKGVMSFCSPLYKEGRGVDLLFTAKRQAVLTNGLVFCISRDLLFQSAEQRIVIRDTVKGDFQDQTIWFESSLLFAPHLRLIMRGDMGCKVLGEKLAARVMPFFPKGTRHLQAKGAYQPSPTGWYYNNNKMLPTNQIRFHSKLQESEKMYFVIDWTGHEPQRFKKSELDAMFS